MGTKKRVRALAICVFRNHGRILVNEGYDRVKGQHFYRPLGGGIEFGEPSTDTICRELMEELNVVVIKESLRYLGALENIFTFNGTPSHELLLIYDGSLKDPELYDRAEIVGIDPKHKEETRAVWKHIDEFGEGKAILYPTGLLEILG